MNAATVNRYTAIIEKIQNGNDQSLKDILGIVMDEATNEGYDYQGDDWIRFSLLRLDAYGIFC